MNQVQRKFIIERIQVKVKTRIEELNKQKLGYPSASNYFFKAILTDKLQLQSVETILAAIKRKAINAGEGRNWLSDDTMGFEKETTIKLPIESLMILPEDFKIEKDKVRDHNRLIQQEIDSLKLQLDTIEVRVQLASDKVLQNMINEVDDMGDLSLIDTKIKLLN